MILQYVWCAVNSLVSKEAVVLTGQAQLTSMNAYRLETSEGCSFSVVRNAEINLETAQPSKVEGK